MSPGARRTVAALAALALETSCGGSAPRPNVVLVSIDSLRWDHVTPYGRPSRLAPKSLTTPNLLQMASEGVLFEQAVSSTTWTLPSHAALLTGLPDPLHGLTDPDQLLDPALDTLPELFARAGYATGGFYSGPNLHPAFGFVQGFETYENCGNFVADLSLFEDEDPGRFREVHASSHRGLTSDRVLDESAGWIAEHAGGERPFFAFVHFWDPHYDYVAPPSYVHLFDRDYRGDVTGDDFIATHRSLTSRDIDHLLALYDAEIRYTDERLGTLLATLDAAGVGDDTIVAVVSDHGDQFFEHGHKGHQREFWEEVVRIPMLLRWRAGDVPAGARPRGQARLQDVYSTLAELADVAAPAYVEAKSLRPLWENPAHPGHPQLMHLELPKQGYHFVGLRTPALKVWWDRETGEGVVYDLVQDPGELAPIAFDDLEGSDDPRVAALRHELAAVEALRAGVPRTEGLEGGQLPASILAELDALGYTESRTDGSPEDERPEEGE